VGRRARVTNGNGDDVPGFSYMKPEDEAAFVRLMLGFIEQHQLRTPDFIKAHIRAFDCFGATEMADFWRDALAVYEQAFALGESKARGDRQIKVVR
jgi:hypothetical protein